VAAASILPIPRHHAEARHLRPLPHRVVGNESDKEKWE
jgi:hypothetical protein